MDKQFKVYTNIVKDYKALKLSELNDRQIWVIATKEIIDADGDIINVRNIDTTDFVKNPVVLAHHNWDSDPVGKIVETAVNGDTLYAKIEFAETPTGTNYYYLYKNGYMNAVSIGFEPIEYEIIDREVDSVKLGRRTVQFDKPQYIRFVFNRIKLLEISVVSIPANQEALLVAASIGKFIETQVLKKDNEEQEEHVDTAEEQPKEETHIVHNIENELHDYIDILHVLSSVQPTVSIETIITDLNNIINKE